MIHDMNHSKTQVQNQRTPVVAGELEAHHYHHHHHQAPQHHGECHDERHPPARRREPGLRVFGPAVGLLFPILLVGEAVRAATWSARNVVSSPDWGADVVW